MAVAMITTFYGTFFANLFFLPMSGKLQRRSATETTQKTILFEGIIGIRNGENPKVMEERLSIYLEDVKKETKPEKAKKPAPAKKGSK
jgi:chemotaxis protein MotA